MRVDQKVLIVLSFSKDSVDNSNMSQNFRAPKRQDYCRQLDPSTRSFQYNGNLPDAIVPTVRGQIAHSSYHLMLTRYWRRSFHLAMSEHMTWRLDLTLCTAWFTPFSSHLKPLHSRCTEWMERFTVSEQVACDQLDLILIEADSKWSCEHVTVPGREHK